MCVSVAITPRVALSTSPLCCFFLLLNIIHITTTDANVGALQQLKKLDRLEAEAKEKERRLHSKMGGQKIVQALAEASLN